MSTGLPKRGLPRLPLTAYFAIVAATLPLSAQGEWTYHSPEFGYRLQLPDGWIQMTDEFIREYTQMIAADPNSPTFGQILTRIDVPYTPDASNPTATLGAMRPCDMSITPDGKFLFEPDLGGESVTAVDIRSKQVVDQLSLEALVPGTRVRPFMLTTNGRIALVENLEGTYAVLDVTDPYNLREIRRLTRDDGVGVSPQTSEFTPDGKYAYLIANGSPAVPGVVSVLDLGTLTITKQITMPDSCRPHAGDFSRDGRHFFVNCSAASSVAVIDTKLQEVVQNVALADNVTPRGVIVR